MQGARFCEVVITNDTLLLMVKLEIARDRSQRGISDVRSPDPRYPIFDRTSRRNPPPESRWKLFRLDVPERNIPVLNHVATLVGLYPYTIVHATLHGSLSSMIFRELGILIDIHRAENKVRPVVIYGEYGFQPSVNRDCNFVAWSDGTYKLAMHVDDTHHVAKLLDIDDWKSFLYRQCPEGVGHILYYWRPSLETSQEPGVHFKNLVNRLRRIEPKWNNLTYEIIPVKEIEKELKDPPSMLPLPASVRAEVQRPPTPLRSASASPAPSMSPALSTSPAPSAPRTRTNRSAPAALAPLAPLPANLSLEDYIDALYRDLRRQTQEFEVEYQIQQDRLAAEGFLREVNRRLPGTEDDE